MSYGNYGQNPYQSAPQAESGYGQYGYDQQNQGGGQYELQPYGNTGDNNGAAAGAGTLSQQDFLSRVQYIRDQIRSLTASIEQIGTLHQRALGAADSSATRDLDALVAQTQLRNTEVKDQIKALERDLARTADGSRAVKTTQLNNLRTTFKQELERYQTVERDYQRRYRDQIARQYRIVNPDADDDEVAQAVQADWGNEGVFQTALRTNRSGQASSVLGAVRARHNELQRIKQTIGELALLYQEMATLIEQQEPIVDAAEQNAQNTVEHITKANEQVDQANKHARNRRKLKWWCLLVVVLIIIVIALGVGIGVGLVKSQNK